ncbi:carbohydrate ABC transporter permease [Maritalea porphyrae]|jgi:alpha-glucoside transport system permease protein|uniref:carbohydrate ABC transporter permease n=1 Tax=Maritalea porphyrae TaxID=880732 RepID=UPI0022AF4A3D|nr:carbohydrate ABC transporter permease [Maritalea porphyrae]MCZ4271482.1 carbohydrate ABC transporter permease [Maritalea porphyrae]
MANVAVADLPASKPSFTLNIDWSKLATHIVLLALVIIWTLPTVGLLVSSVRDKDQLTVSGWWSALTTTQRTGGGRTLAADAQVLENGVYVISGNLLSEDEQGRTLSAYGLTNNTFGDNPVGTSVAPKEGGELTVNADGSYTWVSETEFDFKRGQRVLYTAQIPPRFTLDNYREVLTSEGIDRSFINSFTVTIPATIIPILIAAFAAYALAWMQFPGRGYLVAIVVGLLVVPLQMSLIPILQLYNGVAPMLGVEAKSYLGIWLAHTGFGLPLAIYLLRNYMAGLPKEIMESARMDGASHFKIFTTMVLPLSFPALASFAIFQFLWVWNDLLVATVFLGVGDNELVLTGRLRELIGSRGDNWEILTSGAFISIIVPLIVFFSLQRYFVRGLLAGSVK